MLKSYKRMRLFFTSGILLLIALISEAIAAEYLVPPQRAVSEKPAIVFPDAILKAEEFYGRGEFLSAQIAYQNALIECGAQLKSPTGELESTSAVIEFLISRLENLSALTGESEDFAALLPEVIAAKSLLPLTRRFAQRALSEIFFRRGDNAAAAKISDELQLQRDFLLLGPFANERGHAFTQDLIGENKNLNFTQTFAGKRGKINWRLVQLKNPLAKMDFSSFLQPAEETLAYAAIILESDRSQTVGIQLGSDDAVAVWVNGNEFLRDDVERAAKFGQNNFTVPLQAGQNLLLIKIGQAQENWELILALCATDGSPLTGVRNITADFSKHLTAAEIKMHVPAADENFAPLKSGMDILAKLNTENPRDSRVTYFYGALLFYRGGLGNYAQEPRQLLLTAMQLSPTEMIYPLTLAEISDESARPRIDRDENLRRLALNKVIAISPNSVAALTELAAYYVSAMGTPERANEYLAPALAANRLAPLANVVQADIYASYGWDLRARQLLADLAGRYPHFFAIQKKYADILLRTGAADAALKVLRNLIRGNEHANYLLVEMAANIERGFGESEKAAELWRDYLRGQPESLPARCRLAEILLRRSVDSASRTELAQLLENSLIELAPASADLYYLRGEMKLLADDRSGAESDFAQALALEPTRRDLHAYLKYRGLEMREILAEIPDLTEYIAALNYAPAAEQNGGDRLLYLNEQIDELHPDGTKRRAIRMIFKILSPTGAEQTRRIPVWYDDDAEQVNFVSARVVGADGSVGEAHIIPATKNSAALAHSDDRQMAIAIFPALNRGDIVEIAYVIDQTRPDFFGDYFGYIHRFRRSEFCVRSRYSLRVPIEKKLYFNARGGNFSFTPKTENEQQVWAWEMENLPELPAEKFAPPYYELSPQIGISTFQDWNALARWYWGLVKSQNIATPEILEKVAEIKKQYPNPRDQIAAVYEWVSTEVRNNEWEFGVHGFRPYSAGAVFTRRFGDCKDKATLINVMAQALGRKAYPVLIYATDNEIGRGVEDFSLPLLAHFNHCISTVELDGEKIFIDGTMSARTVASLPFTIAGAQAVIIRETGAELVTTPPYQADNNKWIERSALAIEEDGHADLSLNIRGNGIAAFFFRAWFRNEDIWDDVLRTLGGEKFGRISAASVSEVSPVIAENSKKSLSDEMMIDARLRLRNYTKATANGISCRLPAPLLNGSFLYDGAIPASFAAVFAPASQRENDLILPALLQVERVVKISYPEDWHLTNALPPIELKENFGWLRVSFLTNAAELEINYELSLTQTRVATTDYPAFRRFCLLADQAAKMELQFTK